MEKTLSVEERIRRAEEIYNRRNEGKYCANNTYRRDRRNSPKKVSILRRMFIQVIVCFLVYALFYTVNNREYIFSEEFRKNVDTLLTTETNFYEIYNNAKKYVYSIFSTNSDKDVDKSKKNTTEEEKVNNVENNQITIDDSQSQSDNIGGAIEENINNEEILDVGDEVEKSQMEIDAESIKSSIQFDIPVSGYISSKYGLRNPTTSTVPKNHTGLDIAAQTGTVIKSATDGVVTLASSYGDYGKHYKIQTGDVTIIYAHCSKLYLKEGDMVTRGQNIAEVGSTGNSTGPHLHFEIRKDDRTVDPQLILDV